MYKCFEFLLQEEVGILIKTKSLSYINELISSIKNDNKYYIYYIYQYKDKAGLFLSRKELINSKVIGIFICKEILFENKDSISLINNVDRDIILTEENLEEININFLVDIDNYFNDEKNTININDIKLNSLETITTIFNNKSFYVKNSLNDIYKMKCFDIENEINDKITPMLKNHYISLLLGEQEEKACDRKTILYFCTESKPYIFLKIYFYYLRNKFVSMNKEVSVQIGDYSLDEEQTDLKTNKIFTTMRAAYLNND